MSDTPTLLSQAQRALDVQLATLPEHRTGAAVLVATSTGVNLGYVTRVERDRWELEIGARVGYEASRGVNGGAELLFAWGKR